MINPSVKDARNIHGIKPWKGDYLKAGEKSGHTVYAARVN